MVARAPGRVNLIGEHTDYAGGLALPFAIDRGVTVRAWPQRGDVVAVDALGEHDEFPLARPPRADGWRAFVRGVVAELQAAGHGVPPCRLEVTGDLPQGAGLGASAALSAALGLALAPDVDRVALARMCSRVETDWVGAQTGLLDQFAVLLARDGHALRIDFAAETLEHVPLDLGRWRLITLDSGVAHTNAASGYNQRRAEIEAALGHTSGRLPEPLDRRLRHIRSENARVDAMVAALRGGDLVAAGRLLSASHASLRDDYDVSVPAVEAAVRACLDAGAAGARMIGGGFGGSVLALFGPEATPPPGAAEVRPGPAASVL